MVIKKKCKCGKIFYTWKCNINRGGGKYCSRDCYFKYSIGIKGQKRTLRQRRRMSLSQQGHVPWNKGTKGMQTSYRKGRTWEGIWGKKKADRMKKHLRKVKWTGATHLNKEGYLRMLNKNTGKELLYHHNIWLKENNKRKIPKGHLIHHIDKNILNNKIENLELMKFADHTRLHHLGLKQKRRKL